MKQKIMLNDILNFTDEEIDNAKITLNMTAGIGGDNFLDYYLKFGNFKESQKHCYWSHSGDKKENQRHFTKIGQINVGFVRMNESNKWLLVTIGKILEIPDKPTHCKFEDYKDKYTSLYGRLIIDLKKGNTFSRYNFNLRTYLDKCEVFEILPKPYEGEEFKGFDQINLSFNELMDVLDGKSRKSWRDALKQIKGVYCLTDTCNGKLYIGSATGMEGFAQRWKDYLHSQTGGNKKLIELYKDKGDEYFKKYFTFTVLEWFSLSYDDKKILEREYYWMDVFCSRDKGYN